MDIEQEFIHLARLSLAGDTDNVQAMVRRTFRSIIKRRPDLADQTKVVLDTLRTADATRSYAAHPVPVDADSRLDLLRREHIVELNELPVWPSEVASQLQATVEERKKAGELLDAGLKPTRSLLFVGPPGVGKTLAARWLAKEIGYPFLTLDLAGVMSSYLGRTGNNIKTVLDFARRSPSVLLLDEFDAIAKRRDDTAEIGELKRLVTVLLQAVDDWPDSSLLIAATNHPELLDPAVWRRFDRQITFPLPDSTQLETMIRQLSGGAIPDDLLRALGIMFTGESFAEVARSVTIARREAVLTKRELSDTILDVGASWNQCLPRASRIKIAASLANSGVSLRRASELTGVARQTIRSKRGIKESMED